MIPTSEQIEAQKGFARDIVSDMHGRKRTELVDVIATAIARAIMAEREAERERCAKVAEQAELFDGDFLKNSNPRITIAAAIRKGE